MKTKEKITAIEKIPIELKLMQYFFEFSKEGIKPKWFKDRQEINVKFENGDYVKSSFEERESTNLSLPEYDIARSIDFFDAFFVKKLNQSTFSFKRFIEHEKLVFEIEFNDLSNDPEFPIIKNWIEYLDEKLLLNNPVQAEPHPKVKKETLSDLITHHNRNDIAQAIKQKYSSYKGKDFKILFEALLELDLFPKKGKRSAFFRCLKNEGYNINNKQMLENQYFKEGYENVKGIYINSDDEIQRDTIIEFLKTIIETN